MAKCWIDKSRIARSNPIGGNFLQQESYDILKKDCDVNIANSI